MKRCVVVLVLLLLCVVTAQANTCVGVSGAWTTNGNWTACSGAGGLGPPLASDDVVLNAGTGAMTVGTGSVARSVDLTGYVNTLTHTSGVTLTIGDATAGVGNVALSFPSGAGWTYTLGSTTTSAITFVSTSATVQTVNFGGKTAGNVTFNSTSNGSYQMTGTLATGVLATLALTQGTLDVNGQTLTIGRLTSTGAATRVLTLGAAAITLSTTTDATGFQVTSTGMTLSAASSSITLNGSGTAVTFDGAGLTYGTVILSGAGASVPTVNGANTFTTFTRTGGASVLAGLTLFADQTISGALTLNGSSATVRLLIQSDTLGTPRTLTVSNTTPTVTNADFKDITGVTTGSASWDLSAITGKSGDCGGNSGITFTTAATQTASLSAGAGFNWNTVARWTSRVPLPQDNVVINAAFNATQTVTLNVPRAGKSIDWTGTTGTPDWAVTTATTIYGSLTRIAAMTQSGTTNVTFEGRGSFTMASLAGPTWTNPLIIAMVGGTLTLSDAFVSSSTKTHNNGTWNDGGFASTFTQITSNSGLTRAITRTGNMTLNGTGAVATITSTGLTYTGTGSTITISDATATSKTFAGGGITTFGNITFSGANIIVTGANTFQIIALNNLGDTTGVTLPASTTTTVTGFTTTASSGNVAKLISSSAGTAATLSRAAGQTSINWVSIKDSAATGGATWYAGANSTNVSGNTGWTFTAPPSGTVPRKNGGTWFSKIVPIFPGWQQEVYSYAQDCNGRTLSHAGVFCPRSTTTSATTPYTRSTRIAPGRQCHDDTTNSVCYTLAARQ